MEIDEDFWGQFDKFLTFFSKKSKNDSEASTFHRMFVERKNSTNQAHFTRIPFNKRVLLVPQCLRRLASCTAKESGFLFNCGHCGACAIDTVTRKGTELGYMGVYVLKGGRALKEIIERDKPAGILGVSCWYEGFLGIIECENQGITVTFYPLLKDGCADTDVDVDGLLAFMARLDA